MKKVKNLISSLLVVVMLLTAAPLSGFVGLDIDFRWLDFSTKSSAFDSSSSCGDDVTYIFDEDTGLLTISGTGAMQNYSVDMSSPFYKNSSIKSVVINNGVTSVGDFAFYECRGLTSITISDSVKTIGDMAFDRCSSLISVTIPESVTSIGNHAFYCCDRLTNIIVDESNEYYSSDEYGVLYNKDKTELIHYPVGNSREAFTIPDSVTSIGDSSFYYCTGLTSIMIPDSVTSIGDWAFCNCNRLTSVKIPDSVTSIGNHAFYCCDRLTSITVDESNEYYCSDEYGVLYNKNKTELIQYPVENSRRAFTIPDSVTNIGDGSFYACISLKSITIPDSVTNIGESAFSDCGNLISVTIGNGVTNIGNYAFGWCHMLTSVTIPDSVTKIGEGAFFSCSSLTGITIPDSVTSICNSAFGCCDSLTSITVEERNEYYCSDEYGVLYNKNKTYLMQYPVGNSRKVFTIPDSVTNIGDYAFDKCSSLTSITIPEGVTSIGDSAFAGCSCLTGIIIPDSVTSIGDSAFAGCSCLSGIIIPDGVTSIGDWALGGCTGLTCITISDSVTSIGNCAFVSCNSLQDVYYAGSKKEWHSISIGSYNECLTNATIHYNTVTGSKYTVSFDLNGGSGTLGQQTKNQGEPLTLTSAEPTKTGYIFKSWNTEASGEGMTYLPGSTYNDDKSVVLYAQWEPITYTVRFYDSDVLLDSKVLSYDETGTLSCSFTPEKKGYVFVGWSTVENGPALFEDGIEIKNLSAENGSSVSYYSVWEKLPDKDIKDESTGIQVNVPGGTFDGDVTLKVEEVLSGSSFDIIGKVNGKSKTKVFTIETYVDGQSIQPNGDVTVRIPVPDGFNAEKCKLYYLNTASKNPEEIAFRVEDGYIVFTTNHFSDWAIIQTADKPTVSVNDIGLNYKKSATLNPSVTVDENASYTVTYTSSNPSVARVDENGKVYGAKKGSTDITVTVTDSYGNSVSDTCKVNVKYSFGQWLIVIVLFGWIWY